MTRLGLTVAVLAVSALLCSSSANANPMLFAVGTSASASGFSLPFAGPDFAQTLSFAGWNITASGQSFQTGGSATFDTDTINVRSSGAGTLFLWFSATGFTAPTIGHVTAVSGLTSNIMNAHISSVTLSTFVDPTDGVLNPPPPAGSPLDSATFSAPGLQTQTKTSPVTLVGGSMYSLQELYEVTATGAGQANLTIDLSTSPVPEPATLGLLGSGLLVGVGVLRRRGFKRVG